MRDWHLTQADPYTLRLAADVRLGPTDYADDHIWEVILGETAAGGGAAPPAVAVRTSFGLRASDMRIFPSFSEGDRTVTNPADFASPPQIRAFFVNYARLSFEPLPGIGVTAHYWVPDSHTLAGTFTLVNHTSDIRLIHLGLSAVLKPLDNPKLMGSGQLEEFSVLQGHTGNLDIVIAFGGPAEAEHTPYPTLSRGLPLTPGIPLFIRWVQAAEPACSTCLARLRDLLDTEREWEGDFSRIELINAGLLDIETGDKDWDAAFAFAQTVALRSYVSPTQHLPHASFVFTRNPDRGYSRQSDGTGHNWQWDGQTAAEAYVNLPQILPAAPELAKNLLRNWLAVQQPDGFIDWKPGLAGQRNHALCLPLLATLAWTIYEYTEDQAFLAEVYPGLGRFFNAWFKPKHDYDEDGIPEWSHTVQSAFDNNPSFVRWRAWAQGADITLAEAPDLTSYLHRESEALNCMAAQLGQLPDPALGQCAARLKAAVNGMWRDQTHSYHYVDRDIHEVTRGQTLGAGRGNLTLEIHQRFSPAVRVLIKAIGPKEACPALAVTLTGKGRRGPRRVETFRRAQVQWYWGLGTAVSEKTYAEVERVEVSGLTDEFEVTISTVDYGREDQTLLLPLWARLPEPARADALVRQTILDSQRYWRPYGIANCSALDPAYQPDNCEGSGGVWLLWNTMIGEGLVDYGYRAEAAELITRLMTAMLHTLKNEKAFREAYNADRLEGLGERNHLGGVAPVQLFMRTVGVRIISPHRVFLEGHNPFPWPVTLRYKGVTIFKSAGEARVTFPSGKTVTLGDPRPQFVDEGDAPLP
jgi:hypothetical protein